MNILQVLCLLQLFAVPAFTLTRPSHDYWGEFGPFGPCSRSCGTGVAMRTRKCITSRTDGGHNCMGSSKSFRICNTQECPVGSIDFREEQCSQFDRSNFQGKPYTWVPYYGATNPCELNCVPRGENFFYRHRPAVVDGTKCYVGRSDICVDGVCRLLTLGEFPGLDDDVNSVHSTTPVAVGQHPRETRTYRYRAGVFAECSATCNGGMQYRPVECIAQGSGTTQVVDESNCVAQRLLRPASQQACNMHPCGAEYSVSSFSVCSVTCGEGQQTREVFCVGATGEHLAEHACSGLVRPPAVQACRRPACHTHITWHVTEFGLCTRSCGGGVRERRVGCFDTDLNPFEEARCGPASRPSTVETCNTQPCPGAQTVPSVQDPRVQGSTVRGFVPHVPGASSAASSVQDPRVQGSTVRGFVPHVPGESSAPRLPTDMPRDPYQTVIGPYCAQSLFGCCPDGHTSATGPRNEGCPQEDCVRTRYGCCLDGVTPAQGFGRAGCPDYPATVPSSPPARPSSPPARPSSGDVCSLPRDEGSCDAWRVRFYYDSATGKCTEFWYGNCEGNANNFATLEECQRVCGGAARATPRPAPRTTPRATPRRGATRVIMRARA